jgi:hypothetical protein
VVWNIFSHILGIIIATSIFQRDGYTTNQYWQQIHEIRLTCLTIHPLKKTITMTSCSGAAGAAQTAKKHFQPTKFLQDPVRTQGDPNVARWKKRGPLG